MTPTITSATSDQITEAAGTGNTTTDHAGGTISFADVDLSDRPVVTAPFSGYTYTDANGHALTLTAGQQSDLEAALTITPDANNANNGSATWSYGVVDSKLDFLAQGETLTLTYTATVTDSQNVTATQPITVTIHGTDDAPTLSSVVAGTLTDTSAPDTFTNLTGQLVGHDPDDGETASLTYAVLDGNSHVVDGGLAGQYGTLTVNTDGSYTYVPNAAAINALPAGNFSDQFNVQTTDVHVPPAPRR